MDLGGQPSLHVDDHTQACRDLVGSGQDGGGPRCKNECCRRGSGSAAEDYEQLHRDLPGPGTERWMVAILLSSK